MPCRFVWKARAKHGSRKSRHRTPQLCPFCGRILKHDSGQAVKRVGEAWERQDLTLFEAMRDLRELLELGQRHAGLSRCARRARRWHKLLEGGLVSSKRNDRHTHALPG